MKLKLKDLRRKQRRKWSKPSRPSGPRVGDPIKKSLEPNRRETLARRSAEGWNTLTSTLSAQ